MRYKIFQLSLYSFTLTDIMQLIYSGKSCLLQPACVFHQAMKPLDCEAVVENKALKLNVERSHSKFFFWSQLTEMRFLTARLVFCS